MNDEYLWEKRGESSEIERLEDLLAVYRYEETGPPPLPALNIVSAEKKTSPWRIYFQFAFGAAAVAVILFAVWFGFATRRPESNAIVETGRPRIMESVPTSPTTPDTPLDATSDTGRPVRVVARVKRQMHRLRTRRNETAAFVAANKPVQPRLTKEEKYAYSQLLLALSIAGAKFQQAQDTIKQLEAPQLTSNEK